MTEESITEKKDRALSLAKSIIGYVGFDTWEMECIGDELAEFNDLIEELKID
jgi:hypothetical protein